MFHVYHFVSVLAQHCTVDTDGKVVRSTIPAVMEAHAFMKNFLEIFAVCVNTPMADHRFNIDDPAGFVNSLSMTTVGIPLTAKLTQNRKFLANMLASSQLQEMLDRDMAALRKSLIAKLKFCDTVTMTNRQLKDFYNRDPES